MKKICTVILSVLLLLTAAACQSNASGQAAGSASPTPSAPVSASPSAEPSPTEEDKPVLTEENGVKSCVDTKYSPFDDCGVHTVVDPSAGTVTFTKTDLDGKDTVEYLTFTPAEDTVEKYYYVSMMGTGFYYYYDLAANEMVRMENDKHEDTTESAKSNGRFDSAAESMKAEVEALQGYFSEQFGLSLADAAAGK